MSDDDTISKAAPKGILKQPRPPEEARAIAIHHARLLQHRKDLEAQILDSLILLSEYPLIRDAPYTAASPAPSDVDGFKTHVRLFQPSDYDDLIIERNVNELCGYSLCGKPRKQVGPGGEWKLTASGDIVKRKELEKWCSQACAKRAMYVKVQLNETAAWERAGIPDIHIDLLDEDQNADDATRKMAEMQLEDQRKGQRDAAALAIERGERPDNQRKLEIRLKEKDTKEPDLTMPTGDDDHMVVEGHKVKTEHQSK